METKVLTPTEALAKFKTNFYYAKKYNYPYGGKVEESDVYQTFAKLVAESQQHTSTLEELGYTLLQNDESELFFARYAKGLWIAENDKNNNLSTFGTNEQETKAVIQQMKELGWI